MEAYKKWVRSNRDYVHSMESLANVSYKRLLPFLSFVFCFEIHLVWILLSWVLSFFVQGMTWLLPERFSASEIGPEAGSVIFR